MFIFFKEMVDETINTEDQNLPKVELTSHLDDNIEELNKTSIDSLEEETMTNKTGCENITSDHVESWVEIKHEIDNNTKRTNDNLEPISSENGVVIEKDNLELSNYNNELGNDDRITFGDVDSIDFLLEHLKPSYKDAPGVKSVENASETTTNDLRASKNNEIKSENVNKCAMDQTTCDKKPIACDTSQNNTESFHIEKFTSAKAEENKLGG